MFPPLCHTKHSWYLWQSMHTHRLSCYIGLYKFRCIGLSIIKVITLILYHDNFHLYKDIQSSGRILSFWKISFFLKDFHQLGELSFFLFQKLSDTLLRLQLEEVKQQLAVLVTRLVSVRENHCCCNSRTSEVIWHDPSWCRKSR